MSSSWKQLSAPETLVFLDAVRAPEHSLLFEPSLCETFLHPLDFFDGYDLIRISNQYSPPFVLLDFMSNGENHYYLDGSDHAFQTVCKQGSVRLTRENVLQYIDFYFSYVYERGNSLVFIRDPQNTNFKGSDGMGVHFKAIQKHASVRVEFDEALGVFIIRSPLLYQDQTHEGVIHVHKTSGRIDVLEPLTVSFLDAPQGYETLTYIHPHEDSILEQTKTLLFKSETGQRLMKIAQEKDVPVRVLGSPNYQAFTSNRPAVTMLMPAAQHTADYHQALILAGALRDAEQILGNFPRPSKEEPPAIYFAVNYDKNLNILMEICKIVEELEVPEAFAAMRRIGIEDVYQGYKKGAAPDEMLQIYIAMMMKQGFIKE